MEKENKTVPICNQCFIKIAPEALKGVEVKMLSYSDNETCYKCGERAHRLLPMTGA